MADSTLPFDANGTTDIEMKDDRTIQQSSGSPATAATPDASTPLAQAASRSQPQSRAQSPLVRSSPHVPATNNATIAPPSVANPHGSPVRIYLNTKVTPHLLEGVKHLAAHEPEKPLEWLAEFLKRRSEEVEGT